MTLFLLYFSLGSLIVYFLLSFSEYLLVRKYSQSTTCKESTPEPYTLIVVAKNEAGQFTRLLSYVNEQTCLPQKCIIVLDDTEDDSLEVIRSKALSYVEVLSSSSGKKKGIEMAISQATTDALLLLDADCVPLDRSWAKRMIYHLEGNEAVVGFSGFEPSHEFLNMLNQWEAIKSFLTGLVFHQVGLSYYATGRNLAYRKSAFEKAGGFSRIDHFQGGDDDLMIQKFKAAGHKISYTLEKSTQTQSKAKSTWSEWLKQKSRHQFSGKYYSATLIFLLWAIGFLAPAFLISCLLLAFFNSFWSSFIFLLTFFGLGVFTGMAHKRLFLNQKQIWYVPAFEIILPVVKAYVSIQVALKSTISWR